MIQKDKSCCFTGHRNIPANADGNIIGQVIEQINYLYSQGIKTYLTGGAIGFDTLAARAVIECRETHKDINLILVIPCRDQARGWKQADIDVYEQIKKGANEEICLSEHYYRGCMHVRNRYLVDHSTVCICYLLQESGGTAYTVKYAKSKGLLICNIAESQQEL